MIIQALFVSCVYTERTAGHFLSAVEYDHSDRHRRTAAT